MRQLPSSHEDEKYRCPIPSQIFWDLLLGELDHFLKERLRIKGYVRYMDDFLILGHEKACLHTTLATIRAFLRDVLRLDLKEEVVHRATVTQGIPFLAFAFFRGSYGWKA